MKENESRLDLCTRCRFSGIRVCKKFGCYVSWIMAIKSNVVK